MAKKDSETIATHDSRGNLTGSMPTGGKDVPTPSAIDNQVLSLTGTSQAEVTDVTFAETVKKFDEAMEVSPRVRENLAMAAKKAHEWSQGRGVELTHEQKVDRLLNITCPECKVKMSREDYAYGHDCEA